MSLKKQLLEGAAYREEIAVEGLDEKVTIRPLTTKEWSDVENTMSEEIMASKQAEPRSVSTAMRNYRQASILAVSYGLVSDGPWSPEEVEQIRPASIVQVLADEILRISGVKSQVVDAFNKFLGRGVVGGASSGEGVSPGGSDSGDDPAPGESTGPGGAEVG